MTLEAESDQNLLTAEFLDRWRNSLPEKWRELAQLEAIQVFRSTLSSQTFPHVTYRDYILFLRAQILPGHQAKRPKTLEQHLRAQPPTPLVAPENGTRNSRVLESRFISCKATSLRGYSIAHIMNPNHRVQ